MKRKTQLSTLNSQLFQQGFTLLELLVTASIVTLLIGSGVPAFRRFGRVSELDLAAAQAKSAILETRSLALNPRADKPADALSYSISFSAGSNAFQEYEKSTPQTVVSSGQLPSNVTVSQPVEIVFGIAMQGSITSPTTNPIIIQLTHSQLPGVTRTLSVNTETAAVSILRTP